MQGGNVWEKAGVNVSVVYGSMPPEAYRAATGTSKQLGKENGAQDRVPFFACGISSVMHPHNPFAPTMHFNYRSVCCAWCSQVLSIRSMLREGDPPSGKHELDCHC